MEILKKGDNKDNGYLYKKFALINSLYKDSFSTVAFMNYLYFLSKGKLKVPETGLTKFKNLLNMHKEYDIHEVKPKYSEDDREFKRESEELFNVN